MFADALRYAHAPASLARREGRYNAAPRSACAYARARRAAPARTSSIDRQNAARSAQRAFMPLDAHMRAATRHAAD